MGERGRFDAVVSTSFPLSAHSVAEAVKDLCGAAWVADFRDFYGQFASNGIGRRTPRGAFLARRIAAWGRKAEAITTVSERLADILGRWMGGRRPLVVFNGYFAEHLPRSAPGKPGRTILYAGSFNAQEFTLDPLIAAFRLLQERGVTPPELQFSGTPSAMICALLDAAGIKARFLGAQSNRNLLELQRDAGFLLLLDAMSGPGALLTKTFEYLAARRPMVVVSRPGSDLRETVFDAPAPGYCVSIEANEIADFLASWLERNLVASSEDFYPQDRITHYSRETQARLLLAELERLVAAKAGQ
jgi:glycosyltransferase involved in cell wall biosynthesis